MNCAWNWRTTKIATVNHVRISWNASFTANIAMKGGFVAKIAWKFDLHLYVQSVPITTKVVSSDSVHSEVYSIQHYVVKFASDLRQVRWFFPCTPVSSTIKTDRHDITEILLRVLLSTTHPLWKRTSYHYIFIGIKIYSQIFLPIFEHKSNHMTKQMEISTTWSDIKPLTVAQNIVTVDS